MRFSFSDLICAVFSPMFIAVGLWLTVRLKGIQFLNLGRALRGAFCGIFRKRGRGGGLTSFQAFAAALAGTLGTGNIVGVAAAVTAGGPGALFWMWVSAFLGMVIKYSEIVLAVHFAGHDIHGNPSGGPMRYIERAFGSGAAIFFAGACIAASFGIGNLTQAKAASEALHGAFGASEAAVGAVMAVLVFLAAAGGMGRIGRTAELLVPFMGFVYLGGTFAVILPRISELPGVFRLILSDAFSAEAVSGGVLGVLTGKALRVGTVRGIFTNEAGMGSAPIAHAAADARSPGEEGLWGIAEVFIDTVVMCTLTGTVILLSDVGGCDGALLTVAAFEHFLGEKAAGFVAVSSCLFAFASILVWCGYGESALRYLNADRKGILLYKILYSASVVGGAVFRMQTVFRLSDVLNFLMAAPNLAAIVFLSDTVEEETGKLFGKIYKK